MPPIMLSLSSSPNIQSCKCVIFNYLGSWVSVWHFHIHIDYFLSYLLFPRLLAVSQPSYTDELIQLLNLKVRCWLWK